MTAFPVLFRDVRIEARRTTNYWLRLLAATMMIVVFWGLVSRDERSAHELGARVFPYLHGILALTVALVTPLLTADCLAQEKRDGTLPLLLLTRLTPCAVVTAKLLVHALRGLTLLLAALPLLCLPYLTGGVSPEETKLSVLICFCVLTLGLTGGIVASALCLSWARATLLALLLSCVLYLAFALTADWNFRVTVFPLSPYASVVPPPSAEPTGLGDALGLLLNQHGAWSSALAQLPPGGGAALVALFVVHSLAVALASVILIQCSGRIVRRTSVEHRAPMRWTGWLRMPRFRTAAMRRRRRIQLRRNPIFWLQQRTWSARATRWGWCLGVLLAELLLARVRWHDLWITGQSLLVILLVFGLIYASASSYREEKRNGILEMILVTPLPVWRLVTGRVRSLWRQFLPAFFCWTLFACFLTPPRYFAEDLMRAALVVFTILLITPGVGMEFAVNVRGHWRAVLATSAVVLVVPGIVFLFALGDSWPATFLCCAILWISGMLITPALQLQMKERRLAFLHPHRRQRHHSRWFPRTGTLRLRAYSAVVRALAPPP